MRLNPIRAYHDFQKKKHLKSVLLAKLREAKPNEGVEVPREGEEAAMYAVAAVELCREHPDKYIATRMNHTVLLMRKNAFAEGTSADVKAAFRATDSMINLEDDPSDLF